MKIGETIKRLRKQKDMTQEQLAGYLNISPQAISRWEINATLPDITLVPLLANIFDVTTDVLLGVDIDAKEQRIGEIRQEANDFIWKNQTDEAEILLRTALKEYPNSYILMADLALVLSTNLGVYNKNWNEQDRSKIDEERKPIGDEIIALCEKTLAECTDDFIRHSSMQHLCKAYITMGESEKAKTIAKKMPYKHLSREYLITETLKGTEKHNHLQKQIVESAFYDVLNAIVLLMHTLPGDEPTPYNPDEQMLLHHKIIDIVHILIEEGSFGDFNFRLLDAHATLASLYGKKGNTAAALNHFKLAAEHAISYDAMPPVNDDSREEYSCLLFKGIKFPFNMVHTPHTMTADLLERSRELDSVLPALELEEIRNVLRGRHRPL